MKQLFRLEMAVFFVHTSLIIHKKSVNIANLTIQFHKN